MASQTSTKASQIGWMFVPQYYTFVNKDPARLHCFYTKRSTLIHGVEGEDSQPCYGQQEIHEKIMSLGFEDCKVFVSTVDSQSSAEGGIIVQVVGELSNKGGPWRKFAQTFFLAEQPNGYFVLNDIFRYIKEESDEEEAALAEEGNTTTTAGGDAAAAAPSSSQQQEISYDQMTNAAIVGGQPQQETSAHAGGHDFELAQQHGAPGDAAGVTVAPPQEANQEQTRASLEGLVNGQVEQQQVVELHDDLQPEEAQEQQPAASASASEEAPAARVNGTTDSSSESAPLVPTEADAPSSAADPAAAIAEAQQAGETSSAPVQSQSSTSNTPASLAAAPVQETSKPAAPKSWAHLAAAGSGKWRSAVVSSTAGVSSSVPASSSGASRSSTSAGPSDKAQSSSSTNQKNNNNNNNNADNKGERSEATQQQSRSGKNSETRTPNFTNVETGFSIVVSNITENMSHGLLRQRLSDEFAQLHGSRKEWAKLSYLDIDRQKGVAYVDFEKEWALKKAVEKGTAEIEGTVVTITAGKGGRRDASGLGTGRSPQTGGKGRGDGARQGQGQGQSQGQGQGQGQRGGAGAGAGAGRGGSREGGAQRSQRGGRGAGDKQQ